MTLVDYYADESRSFAIGFGNWLNKYCEKHFKNMKRDSNLWVYKPSNNWRTHKVYKTEELYNLYIKHLNDEQQNLLPK